MEDSKEVCPYCKIDLQGEEIPVELQYLFKSTHFSRKIGIYDNFKDRTVKWMCPDCNYQWDRF